MNGKQLKNSILQWAIQGKLVPQDPNDEPASVLLRRINPKAEFASGNEEYGKVPQGWCVCDFSALFEITMGQSPDGHSINCQQGIEFHQGKILFGNKYLRRSETFTDAPTKIAKSNSILLCVRAPVGVVNITQRDICIGRGLCGLKPNLAIDLDFAYYALVTYQQIFESKSTGSTFKAISGSTIRNESFALPPLAEQRRIVSKLQELEPFIERYGKSEEALGELNATINDLLKKSILQEAIQGKLVPQFVEEGTSSDLLDQIKAEKQKLVKEGKLKKSVLSDSVIYKGDDNRYWEKIGNEPNCIDEEIPFEIPSSWSWIRGKHAFLPMESIKPKTDFIYIDVDAVNNKLNIIDKPKMILAGNAPSRATRKLHKNDILFSMVRPYLKNVALVPDKFEEAVASTGFYVITPSVGYHPQFLLLMMLSNYVVDGLNSFMKGDNSPSINNCHIENYLYPLPPLAEQQRIVAQIEKLFAALR